MYGTYMIMLYGTCMVHVWYIYDYALWYMYGTCMVHI